MFHSSRLSLARKRRGLTKTELAKLAGVSVRSITGWESDQHEPLPETVDELARVLDFPVGFFEGPDLEELTPDTASFRALSKLTAKQVGRAVAGGTLACAVHDWLAERFRLPTPDLPQHLDGEDPERAAEVVRMEWGLGEKPIPNMIHLLEAHGVRVFSLAEDYAELDAFSTWRHGLPFVFLNTKKSGERSRMDAAHELGHLVLHARAQITRGREIEKEARDFASAFLMPKGDVKAHAPRFPSLDQLIVAKKRWKVAVAALTYRMHDLGLLSDWQYRSLYMDISRRGYRKNEPEPIKRESSQVLAKVLAQLRKEGVRKSHIAEALDLPMSELRALMFGLVMTPLEGSGEGGKPMSPLGELRLVDGTAG